MKAISEESIFNKTDYYIIKGLSTDLFLSEAGVTVLSSTDSNWLNMYDVIFTRNKRNTTVIPSKPSRIFFPVISIAFLPQLIFPPYVL